MKTNLLAADIEMFRRLGILPALLEQAGIVRVTDREARDNFGITGQGDMAGIVFPYYCPVKGHRVTARLRRDNPEIEDGKPKNKYISAYGDRRHLYFAPDPGNWREDSNVPVILVEAEKSVLAIAAWAARTGNKYVPVGMGGCWGWRGRIGKAENAHGDRVDELGALPELVQYVSPGRTAIIMLDSNAASNPKVQQAQQALFAQLIKQGADARIAVLPVMDGVNGPDDFIGRSAHAAFEQLVTAAMKTKVGNIKTETHKDDSEDDVSSQPPEFSDDALAARFTDLHGDKLRFTAARGKWHVWDGNRWHIDETLQVTDLVRKMCRVVSAECNDPRTASRIASSGTISAVEKLARSDNRHAATIDQWDTDPWLLNTPGGLVDLCTGEINPPNRDSYCTKITAVAPGGGCPRWLSFLDRITDGNVELQAFLQRVCGYALTGLTTEHCLFFFFGTGANGKSVFCNAVLGMMGDYAKVAPMETFIASPTESHPTGLAGLQGARLVTAAEVEDGRSWAESKLKLITGGDRYTARFMYKDYFEFYPQFKLLVSGNHKPGVRTVDQAMRRRLHMVPFDVTIPPQDRDTDLGEKLRLESGGILRWAIDGCQSWQHNGLNPPSCVCAATSSYWDKEDLLARWIDDECKIDATVWCLSLDLYDDYRLWCTAQGEWVLNHKNFSQALEAKGFVPRRTHKGRGFDGIATRGAIDRGRAESNAVAKLNPKRDTYDA